MSESTAADPAPVPGEASRLLADIEAYEREFRSYGDRADRIGDLYRQDAEVDEKERRFALLWSNVQVLKPTLYARDPKPAVTRRFRDKDMAARVAASLLERCLTTILDRGEGRFGRAIRLAVEDRLLGGRGVVRVRYVPTIRGGMVEDEDVTVEFVHRQDFGHTPGARTWDEVDAVWFVSYLTREEMIRRFGPELGERIPLDCKRQVKAGERLESVATKGRIYKIWDSVARRLVWVAKGMDEVLGEQPYPLRLVGRFPCPTPLFATLGDASLVPTPDYRFYEDQAMELNTLTARIAKLTEALRVVGFVDAAGAPDLEKALDSPEEVPMVPVEGWAMGKAGTIAWLPIKDVATCLRDLIQAREAVKRDAYEVTGLSDILRGQSQASETATAQQIKAQWGGTRVKEAQGDVARLCAECINLMAQVVCGHFEPDRIALLGYMQGMDEAVKPAGPPQTPMPGMMPLPPPTVGEEALRVLKGPGALLHARVDVESDSTIAPDEMAEREAVTGAMEAIGGVLRDVLPALQPMAAVSPPAAAAMANLAGALMGMGLRTIRRGEAVEAAAEAFAEALAQAVQQPPPQAEQQGPPPMTPAEEAKMGLESQRIQLDAAMAQDESRQRDEDRRVQVAQINLEAMRPETAVVQ